MNKKTVFCITFFILSLVVLFMYYQASPTPSLDRFHLDGPRDININGIDFPISWGFLEDENSSDLRCDAEILNLELPRPWKRSRILTSRAGTFPRK